MSYRDRTRQWWTTGRLGDVALPPSTPVTVLVGGRTFSSGEALAYHVQSQGRGAARRGGTPGAADHITPVCVTQPRARVRAGGRCPRRRTGPTGRGRASCPTSHASCGGARRGGRGALNEFVRQSSGPSGGPTLSWRWARKTRSSSSGDGPGASGGGSVGVAAGTPPSRKRRSSPAGVLSTTTRQGRCPRERCAAPLWGPRRWPRPRGRIAARRPGTSAGRPAR